MSTQHTSPPRAPNTPAPQYTEHIGTPEHQCAANRYRFSETRRLETGGQHTNTSQLASYSCTHRAGDAPPDDGALNDLADGALNDLADGAAAAASKRRASDGTAYI